ncbi:MAG TPA: sulfatase-like hydrolase/transferase, partial [Pirellulales bacterium]
MYMPRVFGLWQSGVKFSAHYTAAVACTPARGTLISGLYSQQSWLAQTITAKKPTDTTSQQPQLNPAYPTYGSLLREAGHTTPYIGKWHVSILNPKEPGLGLEPYGFTGRVYPDPTGSNLQGTVGDPQNGYLSDGVTAEVASDYLGRRRPDDAPWCLTVSFVNPHDKEFFWGGTEFQTYNDLFAGKPLKQFIPYSTDGHPPIVSWDADLLKDPQPQGYAPVPPNWESAVRVAAEKPSTQTFVRGFSEAVWGGASDDQQAGFHVVPYPVPTLGIGIGKAPYSYWSRGLDCYTQTLSIVDGRIGQVLDALPADVAQNTV